MAKARVTQMAGGLLANPVVRANAIIIKSVNGTIWRLSPENGHEQWSYQQSEPTLILKHSSSPVILDNYLIAGFANGILAKLRLKNGFLVWEQPIALPQGGFTIQRMVDIDADPIIFGHRVYAATYQGKIAALDWVSGRILWSHDISSYTGMTGLRDELFITDAAGYAWSFDAISGLVNWRQTKLKARILTAPVLMGPYLVVGDAQGYLHWLDKTDGHITGRVSVGGGFYAAPIVDNGLLYAFNNQGYLSAYRLIN